MYTFEEYKQEALGNGLPYINTSCINRNQEDNIRELYEVLQQVEADREAGKAGCTLDELEEYLDDILEE